MIMPRKGKVFRSVTVVADTVPFSHQHVAEESITDVLDYSFSYHSLFGHQIEKIHIEETEPYGSADFCT